MKSNFFKIFVSTLSLISLVGCSGSKLPVLEGLNVDGQGSSDQRTELSTSGILVDRYQFALHWTADKYDAKAYREFCTRTAQIPAFKGENGASASISTYGNDSCDVTLVSDVPAGASGKFILKSPTSCANGMPAYQGRPVKVVPWGHNNATGNFACIDGQAAFEIVVHSPLTPPNPKLNVDLKSIASGMAIIPRGEFKKEFYIEVYKGYNSFADLSSLELECNGEPVRKEGNNNQVNFAMPTSGNCEFRQN